MLVKGRIYSHELQNDGQIYRTYSASGGNLYDSTAGD